MVLRDFIRSTTKEMHFYVDSSTGNDSNNGRSISYPIQTFSKLITLIPENIKHNVVIHLSGTFSDFGNFNLSLNIEQNVRLVIDGGDVQDISSSLTAETSSISSIGFSTNKFTANQYRGYWLHITSGSAQDDIRMIAEHDEKTFYVMDNFSVNPSTATFKIVKPGTIISADSTNSYFRINNIGNGTVYIQRLLFSGSKLNIFPKNNNIYFGGCIFENFSLFRIIDVSNFYFRNLITNPDIPSQNLTDYKISSSNLSTKEIEFYNGESVNVWGMFSNGLVSIKNISSPRVNYGGNFTNGLLFENCGNAIGANIDNSSGYYQVTISNEGNGIEVNNSTLEINNSPNISNCTSHGINLDHSLLKLNGGLIHDNFGDGINSSHSEIIIDSSTIYDNYGNGITSSNSSINISGANIYNNKFNGIELIKSKLYHNGLDNLEGSNVNSGVYAHLKSIINITEGSLPTITGNNGDLSISSAASEETTWENLTTKTINNELTIAKTILPDFATFSHTFNDPGLDNLSPYLTVNDSTETPVFVYRGDGATADNLEPETYGESLDRYGNTPTLDEPTPLLDDVSFKFASDGYYRASNSIFADIETEDIVFEIVFKTYDNDISSRIVWKDLDGIAYKVVIMSTKQLRFVIDPGTSVIIETDVLNINTWYHAIFFADRGGSGQWYVNSVASGDAIDISSFAGTLSNSDTLTVCSSSDGIDYADACNIAYIALWKKENWLDTHLQATIAKERFAKLLGLYPELYYGTVLPEVIQRDSVAYLDTLTTDTIHRQLFLVGNNWLRTCYIRDSVISNILLFGEDFSYSEWGKVGCDAYQSNSVILPDGLTSDGYLIFHEDLSNGNHWFVDNNIPDLVEDTYYCLSVFFKPINRTNVRLVFRQTGANISVSFDLDNISSSISSGDVNGFGIIEHENDWLRCWLSFKNDTTTDDFDFWIYPTVGDTNNYQGEDLDAFYIFGAVMEEGTYPSSYFSTTPYGLQIEPERLNKYLYSEDFSQTEWTEVGCDSYQGGGVILPNGLASEDYIILHEDLSDGNHDFKNNNIPGLVENTYYCISVFVKAIGRNQFRIGVSQAGDSKSVKFFLSDGTSEVHGGLIEQHGIIPYKNGWYKCWMSFLNDITSNVQDTWFYSQNDSESASYQGEDINALYIWGAQFEEGTYPSSYYPSGANYVSRSADLLRYNGDNIKDDNYQGNIKVDILLPNYNSEEERTIINFNKDGNINDSINIALEDAYDYPTLSLHSTGESDGYVNGSGDITNNTTCSIEAIYRKNYADMYVDNIRAGNIDTDCGIPNNINRIEIGSDNNQEKQINGLIKSFEIRPKGTKIKS